MLVVGNLIQQHSYQGLFLTYGGTALASFYSTNFNLRWNIAFYYRLVVSCMDISRLCCKKRLSHFFLFWYRW